MTTKRRKLLAFVLLAVIAGVVAYGLLKPKNEPKYQGRDLSDWLDECSKHTILARPQPPAAAEAAVRNIGTNALPYLMKWIAAKPPAWRAILGEKLPAFIRNRESYADWLHGDFDRRWRNACVGFMILGTNAVSAIPELMKGATRSGRWSVFNSAVSSIGPPAIPALKAALADPNQPSRDQIVISFVYMADWHGTNACLPVVIELLNHEDIKVRSEATNAIWTIEMQTLIKTRAQ